MHMWAKRFIVLAAIAAVILAAPAILAADSESAAEPQAATPAAATPAVPAPPAPVAVEDLPLPAPPAPAFDSPAALLREADKDGDGALSKEEFMAFQEALFAKGDSNADGKLALEEIAAMLRRLSAMGPRPSESMPGLPPGVVPPPPPPGATISLFMRYDADGDGKISKDEMPEKMRPFLASMDSNGDGFVDEEEAGALAQKAVPAAPAPGAPSVSFLRYDQDNDGAVSREEMPEALGHLIDRLDANGDGKVDRAELDQMRQRMESMGGGRGAGGDLPQPKVEQ